MKADRYYICDPRRATNCPKTLCFIHDGPCHLTRKPEQAKINALGQPIAQAHWLEDAEQRIELGEASINQLRAELGMKPVPGGDVLMRLISKEDELCSW